MESPGPEHPTKKDHQQQQQQHETPQQVTEAGVVRACVRATASVYRTIVFGSMPRRVPVRAIGPLTDRLATAYDALSALRGAHQEQQQQQQQQGQQGGGTKGGGATKALLLQKMQLFGITALQAAPTLVKSAALGTVVFELYEEGLRLAEQAASVLPPPIQPLLLSATCIAAGGAAGACHGTLYYGWEYGRVAFLRLWASVNPPPRPTGAGASTAGASFAAPRVQHVLGGTTAAHALAHGTLFGSFEVMKEALFVMTGAKHEEPLGVFVVGVAGAIAGVCEETASHFTQAWELEGVSSLPQALKRLGAPPLRSIAKTASLPSAIGFLAFEYGRVQLDDDDDDDDEEDGD